LTAKTDGLDRVVKLIEGEQAVLVERDPLLDPRFRKGPLEHLGDPGDGAEELIAVRRRRTH
jgi:hypothetical protein